jgi:hypothetical protein
LSITLSLGEKIVLQMAPLSVLYLYQAIIGKNPLHRHAVAANQPSPALAPAQFELTLEPAPVGGKQYAFAVGQIITELPAVDAPVCIEHFTPTVKTALAERALITTAVGEQILSLAGKEVIDKLSGKAGIIRIGKDPRAVFLPRRKTADILSSVTVAIGTLAMESAPLQFTLIAVTAGKVHLASTVHQPIGKLPLIGTPIGVDHGGAPGQRRPVFAVKNHTFLDRISLCRCRRGDGRRFFGR